MRFRVPELFLGAFLAVAIFSMGILFSSQYPGQSTQTQRSEKSSDEQNQSQKDEGLWNWITRDAAGFFTLWLVVVGGGQLTLFYVQLKLIRETLAPAEKAAKAAQDAATAAKTQADALMASECARLYVIIKGSNILPIFQAARWYDNSPTMNAGRADPPELQYVLKNYGKTPATLIHVWHGISVGNDRGGRRTLVARDGALEIIGVDGESRESILRYDGPYTFGDSRALVTEEKVLTFFGEADYQDIFGTNIHLEWEFIADRGTLHQIQHREQRQTPDATLSESGIEASAP